MTQEPLCNVAPGLRDLLVPIDSLGLDPANARTHSERNLAAIRGSYQRFGQRKPIVCNRTTHTVIAGNGQLQAAIGLGWTHVAVIFVDDAPLDALAYALADNRTGELAGWDDNLLIESLRTLNVGGDLTGTGFSLDDVAALTAWNDDFLPDALDPPGEAAPNTPYNSLMAVIRFDTVEEQREFYRLIGEDEDTTQRSFDGAMVLARMRGKG